MMVIPHIMQEAQHRNVRGVRFGSGAPDEIMTSRVKQLPPDERKVFSIMLKPDPALEKIRINRRHPDFPAYQAARENYIQLAATRLADWFRDNGLAGQVEVLKTVWLHNEVTVRATRATMETMAAAPELRPILDSIDVTFPGEADEARS
jgi:hypothetical protein